MVNVELKREFIASYAMAKIVIPLRVDVLIFSTWNLRLLPILVINDKAKSCTLME